LIYAIRPDLWKYLFELHRLIKNERHSGKWSNFIIEVNPEWKEKLDGFVSSKGKSFL